MNEHDFQLDGTVLVKYCGDGGEVVIPEGITEIGSYAFAGNTTVTAVTIPGSVGYLNWCAFEKCTALERVDMADGVNRFHNGIFEGCSALREVRLSQTAVHLGKFIFKNCSALESVTLPQSLESVPDSAFEGCTALKSVVIPDNVKSIFSLAFAGCSALEKIHLGASVSSIWNKVFAGCTSLKEITVSADNSRFIGNGLLLLSKDGKNLEQAMPGIAGEFTVPDGVQTVKSCAFEGCNELKAIRFAPSVTEIEYCAFQNCEKLDSIVIPATVKTIGISAFMKQTRWGQPVPKAYQELIVAPEAGETMASGIWIGPGTGPACYPQLPFRFSGSKEDKQRLALGYILNPEKYTEEYARDYLKYVKSQRKNLLTLAKTLKLTKQVEAFYAALDQKPGAKPKKKAEAAPAVASPAAENANAAEEFEIADGCLVKYLGQTATVVLPGTVERIGEKAFYGCKKLEKVVLPQSVNYVENKAFVTCPKLKTVVIYSGEITLDFNFYKFRGTLDVIAPNLSPAVFPAANRQQSVVSLAHAVAEGTVAKPAAGSKIAGYLKRSNHQFFAPAEKDEALMDLMIHCGAITGKEVPELLELWKNITPEGKLKLMELTKGEKQTAPAEKLESGLSGKGPTVAELKKDWSYGNKVFDKSFTGTETIKGISLHKYKGFRSDVEIPAFIGKTPVLEVGVCAFSGNTAITSVKIPETVFSVADRAFEGCTKLERVEHFGQKLRLSSYVFQRCEALSSFATSAEEFRCGIHPFLECGQIYDADGFVIVNAGQERILVEVKMPITNAQITVPQGVTRIGGYAFGETLGDMGRLNSKLERVVLPNTVRQIEGSAFSNAKSLREVVLPQGLVSIASMAFYGCTALRRIYIPASVTEVGGGAFYQCAGLTIHGEPDSAAQTFAQKENIPFVAGKYSE